MSTFFFLFNRGSRILLSILLLVVVVEVDTISYDGRGLSVDECPHAAV